MIMFTMLFLMRPSLKLHFGVLFTSF